MRHTAARWSHRHSGPVNASRRRLTGDSYAGRIQAVYSARAQKRELLRHTDASAATATLYSAPRRASLAPRLDRMPSYRSDGDTGCGSRSSIQLLPSAAAAAAPAATGVRPTKVTVGPNVGFGSFMGSCDLRLLLHMRQCCEGGGQPRPGGGVCRTAAAVAPTTPPSSLT
jgi:hypothetical protein